MNGEGGGRGVGCRLVILLVVLALLGGVWLGISRNDDAQPRREQWSGWVVVGQVALVLLGLPLAALSVYAVIRLAISLRAVWHEHQHQRELDALMLERTADEVQTDRARYALDAARVIPCTEHGRLGALVRQTASGWQVVNLDAEGGALLMGNGGTVDRALLDPLSVAQLQARHALELERARAAAYPELGTLSPHLEVVGGEGIGQAAAPAVRWPERVLLRDLVGDVASTGRLVLGVTVGDDGQAHPVTASLTDLVHIAVGGSSGWGKSVFLRSLALQLATSAEPVAMALIDLEGTTFAPFTNSERLLWPVADTEAGALGIVGALVGEMNRRRELYAEYPGVDSLSAYNLKVTGNTPANDERLEPVVCLIDEATALLSDRDVHSAARTLALRARKYGVWLVLGGQDWKAASIDTAIRNQISTRVHFKAQSASQSRVLLGDGCAAAIETPGRAWAQLPGRPLLELQAPLVSLSDIQAVLAGQQGPTEDPPTEEPEPESDQAPADLIRTLAGQGLSLSAIAREVFGYTGGAAYEAVRQAMGDTTTLTGSSGRGDNGRGNSSMEAAGDGPAAKD